MQWEKKIPPCLNMAIRVLARIGDFVSVSIFCCLAQVLGGGERHQLRVLGVSSRTENTHKNSSIHIFDFNTFALHSFNFQHKSLHFFVKGVPEVWFKCFIYLR